MTLPHSAKTLSGRHVLVVEDEYFIADDLVSAFAACGARILGPAATLQDALALVAQTERIDCAVLDINLQGEMVYPLADALARRGVPFVFATGYNGAMIDQRYVGVPRCEKPVSPAAIAKALLALQPA
jgi:CheY-like chemotaxis protein